MRGIDQRVTPVLLDLGAGFDKAAVQTSVPTTVRGDADNILTSVENQSGSNHGDSLRGNAGNRIFGGLGADALRGGAAVDPAPAECETVRRVS